MGRSSKKKHKYMKKISLIGYLRNINKKYTDSIIF